MHRARCTKLAPFILLALVVGACEQKTEQPQAAQPEASAIPEASTDDVVAASESITGDTVEPTPASTPAEANEPEQPEAEPSALAERHPDWALPIEFDASIVARQSIEAVSFIQSMRYLASRQRIEFQEGSNRETRTLLAEGEMKFDKMPQSEFGFRFRCTGQSWGFKNQHLIIDVAFDGVVGYWLKAETRQLFRAKLEEPTQMREFGGAFGLLPIELVGSDLRMTLDPNTDLIRRGRAIVGDVVCDVLVARYEEFGERVEATWLIGARDKIPRQLEQRRIPPEGVEPVRESFLLRIGDLDLDFGFTDDDFRIATPPGYTNVAPESVRDVDAPR